MDQTVALARGKSAANPFISNRVDSAWDTDAVDVEAINRTAFERCRETIELVRSTVRCRGLLLSGEPGSWKARTCSRGCGAKSSATAVTASSMCLQSAGRTGSSCDLLQHTV